MGHIEFSSFRSLRVAHTVSVDRSQLGEVWAHHCGGLWDTYINSAKGRRSFQYNGHVLRLRIPGDYVSVQIEAQIFDFLGPDDILHV